MVDGSCLVFIEELKMKESEKGKNSCLGVHAKMCLVSVTYRRLLSLIVAYYSTLHDSTRLTKIL